MASAFEGQSTTQRGQEARGGTHDRQRKVIPHSLKERRAMTQTAQSTVRPFTAQRAILLAALSLMVGIAAGYVIRGVQLSSGAQTSSASAPALVTNPSQASPQGVADVSTQAAPL